MVELRMTVVNDGLDDSELPRNTAPPPQPTQVFPLKVEPSTVAFLWLMATAPPQSPVLPMRVEDGTRLVWAEINKAPPWPRGDVWPVKVHPKTVTLVPPAATAPPPLVSI